MPDYRSDKCDIWAHPIGSSPTPFFLYKKSLIRLAFPARGCSIRILLLYRWSLTTLRKGPLTLSIITFSIMTLSLRSFYAECHILFTIMLNVIMLSVIMLNIIMLSVIILSVIILNIVMLSVMAPSKAPKVPIKS